MKKGIWIFGCFIAVVLLYGLAIAGDNLKLKQNQGEEALPGIIGILLGDTVAPPPETLYPLPDTGQKKCYNDTVEIACPSAGNDFYGQDAQYPRFPRSYTKLGENGTELSDDANHVDNGGNWIMTRDNVTGLIWEIKTNANKNSTYTWQQAQTFFSSLNTAEFGGYTNWRMPSRMELALLADRSVANPGITTQWFPNTQPLKYWSSSVRAEDNNYAWRVHFFDGFVNYDLKTEPFYVRAVRNQL